MELSPAALSFFMTYFIVAYYEMKSHACLLLFIVLITSLQLTIYDGNSAALPAFNNIQPMKQTWNGICCQLKATDHTTRHLNASWYGFLAGFMRPHFTQSYLYWHDIGLWYEPYIPWNMNLILLCFVLIVVLLPCFCGFMQYICPSILKLYHMQTHEFPSAGAYELTMEDMEEFG